MFNKRTTKNKLSIFIFVGVLVLVILVIGMMSFIEDTSIDQELLFGTVYLAGDPIEVEIVHSLRRRAKGLSGKAALAPNNGMLFVFDESSRHGFWMKDMHFPIDIIWINEAFVIVDIKDNAEPNSFPEVFYPKTSALYVLEVNASLAKSQSVIIGSTVSFENIIRD